MDIKNYDYKQKYIMNNVYSKSNSDYNQIIWDTISSADDIAIKLLNNKIYDVYNAKLNLINNLLNSSKPLPLNNLNDIIKFFNIITPLNNEYNLGSYNWNIKIHDKNLLLIQNSILKSNFNNTIYQQYLKPIKNILKLSNLNYNYFEIKSSRFYKSIDIIFTIQLPE